MANRDEASIKRKIDQHNYTGAEDDLRAIILDKPQSAKAHYWLGQVLGYQGHASDGLTEIQLARAIDPKLGFTTATQYQRVEAQLRASLASERLSNPGAQTDTRTQASATSTAPTAQVPTIPAPRAPQGTATTSHPGKAPATPESGFDMSNIWVIGIGLFVAFMVFRWFRSRQTQRPNYPPQAPGGAPNYPPGYPPQQQSSGLGTAIPAALGGFLLGEMLSRHSDAGASTVTHERDLPYTPPASAPDDGGFDAGSDDGGSFGGDGGGGFDSGGGDSGF
jgi:uncharacterized protein